MRKFSVLLLIPAFALLATGCSYRLADFSLISTKNVPPPVTRGTKKVEASDCVPVVIFPLGLPNPEEAIDRAIEEAGPEYDALTDVAVYYDIYAFLFGKICWRVSGLPIRSTDLRAPAKEGSTYFHSGRRAGPPA